MLVPFIGRLNFFRRTDEINIRWNIYGLLESNVLSSLSSSIVSSITEFSSWESCSVLSLSSSEWSSSSVSGRRMGVSPKHVIQLANTTPGIQNMRHSNEQSRTFVTMTFLSSDTPFTVKYTDSGGRITVEMSAIESICIIAIWFFPVSSENIAHCPMFVMYEDSSIGHVRLRQLKGNR